MPTQGWLLGLGVLATAPALVTAIGAIMAGDEASGGGGGLASANVQACSNYGLLVCAFLLADIGDDIISGVQASYQAPNLEQ